ncbi:hypothetical protein CFC21_058341 [Triticum aestivum]|uniref:Zinc knuckle CX2CX4HX4C domain-containing protein n=2 Tax=Triticum aestivum TaxID=4565 RepID=A0A3B6IVU4_WHEAT|nr:hypothetical protein CFC21_058341 [Triticum aestivum]
MASSDANSATSGGASASANPVLEDFFDQLDLNDEDFNDVEIDEEDPVIQESVRWLALARVHTEKNFSPAAFYKDMRAAWNPAQSVRFRPVGPNRFVVQASCLGDWERMLMHGPWLFRNMAVLMCPYDRFTKADEVVFDHLPIWLQIHKLPDPYCKQEIVGKLLNGACKILEMRLNGNTRGDYIRVRVEHDIKLPLTKFVSIVRSQARQVYLVRYEKLARFCKLCGLIGHEHKECGSGVHDQQKLKFGDWLYGDGPSHSRPEPNPSRTGAPRQPGDKGSSKAPVDPGTHGTDPDILDTTSSPTKVHRDHMELEREARKRLNMDIAGDVDVHTSNQTKTLLAITDGSRKDEGETSSPSSSTSSSKRAKLSQDHTNNEISAASLEEDRRMQ